MNPSRMAFVVACLVALGVPANAVGYGTSATGTLVQTHGHRADGTEVSRSYAIGSGPDKRRLRDEQPASLIGQRVRVIDDDGASGLQGRARAQGEQRLAAAVVPGPRSMLVILLSTPDAPTPPATPDAARTAVFTGPASTNAFYEQQSAGATRFVGLQRGDGDVAGPLSIGVPIAGCDEDALAAGADDAARAAGWAVDAYDHVLYALPRTTQCRWAGLAELTGSRSWSNGGLSTRVVAHELGHNLGAHHADALRCAGADGGAVTLSADASCTSREYADPFDVMGLGTRLMSSWHRARIGQLPGGQELRARESQTATLVSSDEFTSSGPRLLLVPRKKPGIAVSSWLAVELRSVRAPFDLWDAGDPVTTGLSVRVVPALTVLAETQLLDARPATSTVADSPLQVGETLRDDTHSIAIRLDSIAGTTAAVTVTMPRLVDDVPPSAAGNLSFGGNTNGVVLRWTAAADDEAVDHYEVQRDGVLVGTTSGLTFDDARVAAVTDATYRVTSVDTSGNRGTPASLRAVLADATAPGAVPGLAVAVTGADVRLSWSAAQDNRAIGGYRVSREGALVSEVTGLGFTERPPVGRYRYAVAAVDTAGNVGASTEVLMPSPTTTPGPITPGVAPGSAPVARSPVPTPPGAPGASSPTTANKTTTTSRPRIVTLRRSRKGRVVTMTFRASGATSMSAYRGARRVARAGGSRLTVRLTVPRGVKRPRVRILAASPAGSVSRSFELR